jgi:hypothetical protein
MFHVLSRHPFGVLASSIWMIAGKLPQTLAEMSVMVDAVDKGVESGIERWLRG